jgi:pyruvate/2-oxoglutarate dehydrogenase complex dihydrolipoamide acyltransferase (E2) component
VATLVRFPKIGENIEEGMVGVWLKQVGDAVTKGEGLVELITDKATFNLESPADGALGQILAPEKSVVPTNYILAILGPDADTQLTQSVEENLRLMEAHRARSSAQWSEPARAAGVHASGRVRATPAARRMARQAGLSIDEVKPAAGDIVTEDDVQRCLQSMKGQ